MRRDIFLPQICSCICNCTHTPNCQRTYPPLQNILGQYQSPLLSNKLSDQYEIQQKMIRDLIEDNAYLLKQQSKIDHQNRILKQRINYLQTKLASASKKIGTREPQFIDKVNRIQRATSYGALAKRGITGETERKWEQPFFMSCCKECGQSVRIGNQKQERSKTKYEYLSARPNQLSKLKGGSYENEQTKREVPKQIDLTTLISTLKQQNKFLRSQVWLQ